MTGVQTCALPISVELNNCAVGEEGGLTVYMTHAYHYDLMVKQLADNQQAVTLYYRLGNMGHTEKTVIVPNGKVYLRVVADNDYYNFYYSTDNKEYTFLEKMDVRFISSETAGGFTGVYFGLFAAAPAEQKGSVDFEWFDYQELTDKK